MSIFAIADLHLSLGTTKQMDIFAGWEGYTELLHDNWCKYVSNSDTVVIPGDISWAMKLEDTLKDFTFIHNLPGHKVFIKGNHDYWWTTANKMNTFIQDNGLDSITFLHNSCYLTEGVAICGTRSWLFEHGEPLDQKLVKREAGRLTTSLKAAGDTEKIVFLHYPPIFRYDRSDIMIDIMMQYDITHCYYGHLHSHTIKHAFNGTENGIHYKLISSDALRFAPFRVR